MTFDGKSESVRDVRFSPQIHHCFCAAFDNGTIQLWDIRKYNTYERKITAHQGPVFCIDWHPDCRTLLASGGRDRFIQVWSLDPLNIQAPYQTTEPLVSFGNVKTPAHIGSISNSKPYQTIQTISSVSHIHWRAG